MNERASIASLALLMVPFVCRGGDGGDGSIRARWESPAACDPFAPVRIKDLKEELRQTGYRLVIAIHPRAPDGTPGEPPPRDLFIIDADGTGLEQLTRTPDIDERVPRTAPNDHTSHGAGGRR